MKRKLIFCIALLLLTNIPSRAFAQGPVVVKAVDNDPENRLWNCETNRVPFNNQEVDRSRCFTFRYPIPAGGISSATVHIALDTLGSLQDTDATIVAVDKPVENCSWGQGNMPGCVVLHGGFKGGEKSLNLNLLNITCDPTIQNTAESQQLVRQALESGVLHMELQDDTAVYSAQLVLNGGAPSFTCGTSEEQVSTFIPTPGSAGSSSGAAVDALDKAFNPPQYLIHATGHSTTNGSVTDDLYLLFPSAPSNNRLELPDGSGGTFTYSSDYSSGPYTTPRQVCRSAGDRLGSRTLSAWNGSEKFTCTSVATTSANTVTPSNEPAFLRTANEFLTGTPNPSPPSLPGAAAATVAGAIALAILAASNYLLTNSSFVQSALQNAARQASTVASVAMARGESVPGTAREHPGGAERQVEPTREHARDVASPRVGGTPLGSSGASGSTTLATGISADAGASAAPGMNASSGAQLGAQGIAGSADLGAVALDKAVEEGIGSVPDLSDLIKDKLIEKAEKREQREILQAEQKRLQALISTQERRLEETRQALKQTIDSGGDFDSAQRAWRQAEHDLAQTRPALEQVVKRLAALEAKSEEKEE